MPSSSGGKDNVCQKAAAADSLKISSSHALPSVRLSSRRGMAGRDEAAPAACCSAGPASPFPFSPLRASVIQEECAFVGPLSPAKAAQTPCRRVARHACRDLRWHRRVVLLPLDRIERCDSTTTPNIPPGS
jgi:hypothetical protein